ncbi:MAG: chemotaxis protein CheV [Desulfamplus sp.]|nr:chemotaxis protein CheV [Desulfamplus sp.]
MQSHGILLGAGTNEMELLTVWIQGQLFGINVAKVQSVESFDRSLVTSMPENPPEVLGMLLHRNRTLPLIDLQILLKIKQNKLSNKLSPSNVELTTTHYRDIVVVTEFNNKLNAFKVQGVNRIFRFSWSDFVPISPVIGSGSYVVGSVYADGHEIMVLDLEQALSSVFPNMVLEEVSVKTMQKREVVSRDKLNILFAEDSSIIRKGVMRVLKEAGFIQIKDFENGQAALDYCLSNVDKLATPELSTVMITDIEMPQMDGLTLCKIIKEHKILNRINVVVFSSLINTQMIEKCKRVNADSYVTKPESNSLIDILDGFCLS